MIFTQLVFFAFFLVCFVVHWVLPWHRSRKLWLLLCSYFFYGFWDHRFLILIVASTTLAYFAGRAIGSSDSSARRRSCLVFSVVANLGLLGFFKYYNFFVSSAAAVLHALGVSPGTHGLKIILPVGISFFTFQAMSYTIDVYRGRLACRRDFLDFAMYVSFFPQLVAGPIVRAKDFLPQLDLPRRLSDVDARGALTLFWFGYFKKACVADNIAVAIDPVFANPLAHGQLDLGLSACLYSVQIYCDFSGYTDMAIAIAACLGYRLRKNFDAPYFSTNVREFWQRWHISLSSWLRDYLYIALGGNRGGAARTAANLMLTMLLGGLWHGANWTFVLWGFMHGAALIVHRVWATRVHGGEGPPASRWLVLPAWLATLGWVVVCFTIFRCPDIAAVLSYFEGLLRSGPDSRLASDGWLLVALLGAVHWIVHRYGKRLGSALAVVPDTLFFVGYGAACAVLPFLSPLNAAPFIYFQF